MKKAIKYLSIFFLLFLFSPVYAEELVLQLRLGKVVDGGIPPEDNCNNSSESKYLNENGDKLESVCIHFYRWAIYEAKVKKVIAGKYSLKNIKIAMVQHSYFNRQYKKNIYVHLKRLDEKRADFLGVEYYVYSHDVPEEVVCFDERLPYSNSQAYLGKLDQEECYAVEKL